MTIGLEGNLGQIIGEVLGEFEKLDQAVNRVKNDVTELNPAMRSLAESGVSAANAWAKAATAIERAANAASRMPRGPLAMPAPGTPQTAAEVVANARANRGSMPTAISVPELTGPTQPYQPQGGSASNMPVLWQSQSRDAQPVGQPFTPYGAYGPSRPPRGPGTALVPFSPLGGGGGDSGEPPRRGGGYTTSGDPYDGPYGGPVQPYGGTGRNGEPIDLEPPSRAQSWIYGGGPERAWNWRPRRHRHSWQTTAMESGVVAYGGYEAGKHVVDLSAEASQLKAGLRGEGFTDKQVKAAYDEAFKVQQKVRGSDVLGNLQLLSEIQSSVQNADEAMKLLPVFAKYKVALSTLGRSSGAEMLALIKLADETNRVGSIDPKTGKWDVDLPKLDHYLKTIVTATGQTYGNVDPQQMLLWQRNLNWSGQNLPDDAIFQNLALIQALGASRAGRGLFAVEQQWAAGQMSQVSADMAIQFGLIKGGGTAKTNPHVKVKGFGTYMVAPDGWAPGVSEQLRTHPQQFLLETLVPHLDTWIRAHIPGYDRMTPAQKSYEEIRLGSAISSRDPARAYLGELVSLRGQVDRDVERGQELMRHDVAKRMTEKNAKVDLSAFGGAWQAFELALGNAALQPAIAALNALTGDLNSLSDWARKNPDGAKKALEGLAAGVGAFAAGSAAALAMGVLTGPGGFIAVAAGIEALGHSLTSMPPWLIHIISGAAAGGMVAGAPGAAVGAGVGAAVAISGSPTMNKKLPSGASPTNWLLGGPFGPELQWMQDHWLHASKPAAPMGTNNGQPVAVHVTGGQVDSRVTNPGDLVHGVASGIANQSNRPPSGVTGHDLRIDLGSAYAGFHNR